MQADAVLKKFLPMSETAFYILLSLTKPRHGYGIIGQVEKMTQGRIRLGSGTVYGTLKKMQRSEVICVYSDEERKTVYETTDIGKVLLQAEMKRLKELYGNALKYGEVASDEGI